MLENLDLFHGDTTDNLSHVYARLSDVEEMAGLTLSGHVRGPFCQLAKTLPVTAPLEDLGPGQSVLAQAIVTDPCFWSPDLPSLYEVHVELLRRGEVVETVDGSFGVRSFGTRAASLFLSGRRWVPRGVFRSAVTADDLAECRETSSSLVIEDPADDVCALASQSGVFIVAIVAPNKDQRDELRRLARYAAVGIAVVHADTDATDLKRLTPNLLLAAADWEGEAPAEQSVPDSRLGGSLALPTKLPPWADLVMGEVETPESFCDRFAGGDLPVVASRRIAENRSIAEARAECDRLQRDLAPLGDFAGYFV